MYLLKISISYNKKRIHLLNLLISWISVRSAPKILSEKGDCIVLFQKSKKIFWCHFSANSLLETFSFLTVLLEDFLSKS